MSANIIQFRPRTRPGRVGVDSAFEQIVAGILENRAGRTRMANSIERKPNGEFTERQALRIVDLQLDRASLADAIGIVAPSWTKSTSISE